MTQSSQRIVLKFGSGILALPSGNALDEKQFRRLAGEVAALVSAGHGCVIVSSGAVAAGMRAFGLKERPTELAASQACAAIGQSKLMELYAKVFAKHRLNVAQLLLTHGDLDSRTRQQNAQRTLQRLLACKNVVPIINENDSVAVEELRFGDNDRLSAEVAVLARASLLILLTSVDGLLDAAGKRVPLVTDIERAAKLARDEKGKFSVGGMISKLQAVRVAIEEGIPTVIASGRKPGQITAIAAGEEIGTRFAVKRARRAGKSRQS